MTDFRAEDRLRAIQHTAAYLAATSMEDGCDAPVSVIIEFATDDYVESIIDPLGLGPDEASETRRRSGRRRKRRSGVTSSTTSRRSTAT